MYVLFLLCMWEKYLVYQIKICLYATRLRLSSQKLAIETGRWSRIPREDRLCPCSVIQMEEHVICRCPLSDHIQSQFGAVSFSNIAKFF